jgi:hypothetical protein
MRRVVLLVSVVALLLALVGALAGVAALVAWGADVASDDFGATLGVVSIVCGLGAVPLGIIGWRWAERRAEPSVLGQAAGLIGGTTSSPGSRCSSTP